jgi:Kef-type K+ transport system membrane component KefB
MPEWYVPGGNALVGYSLTPFIQSLLLFTFILLAAKAAGYLSIRFHQPSVLGELLVGLLLGPTLIDILHLQIFHENVVFLEELVKEMAEIGVLLLMFVAGAFPPLQAYWV